MALNYLDLDDKTREHMLLEIQFDKENNNFYYSNYLSEEGKSLWPLLLEESVQYDDTWLENEIRSRGMLAQFYTKRKPKSTELMQARVPITAAQTLAEGEFSRLYARGLCSAVVSEGGSIVEAYRARVSTNPRPESAAIIGKQFSAQAVLNDLRSNPGVDSALGVPPGPNSGISLKRVK
ncbi:MULTISPECIES: hypothetical protein [Photorhabdus]|uniref:Uncharacterized protein n=2 Tax=Photorhabdus TaxID=29487 RepID=A0A329VNF7_9GAMM|nr:MULTISPECIES: hypothetical protein [Photorhabdus]MCC8466726.1 hypothetical protein [Photorhabdus bodei]MDB6372620.1 hypothetical protein [Photorhabdus bodei]RAW92071.1 hypothetical protein CKY01_06025 [Photorhabdus laumondii subsp. clarkei]